MGAPERTRVAVVGGGPAGMVLGLLLARGGVDVTVLEKHADFLRDFRGDTVHASTLTLLDELGLADRFAALPHRRLREGRVQLDAGEVRVAALAQLPGAHQEIALVPQWDFLEMLAGAAAEEPSFRLVRNAEAVDLMFDAGRVAGVVWRDRSDGGGRNAPLRHLSADLVVACDGRFSQIREAANLWPRSVGVPIDVQWFRIPRGPGDPEGLVGRASAGQFLIMIDRGDYWQCGYVIAKGRDAKLRAEGIGAFRDRLAALQPWLADRLGEWPASYEDVRLLDVQLNRLPRWHRDGLLAIGDAAHAMSPVFGVGINLAIQDAVAAARILGPTLRRGRLLPQKLLAQVQRRRAWPAAVVQAAQRAAHLAISRGAFDAALSGTRIPAPLRLVQRFPALAGLPARFIAIGPLPEHAPAWATRPSRTPSP